MSTETTARDFQSLPRDYAALCCDVWLPRPIRDRAEHDLALNALAPIWRHEAEMSADQAAWFSLVTDLVNRWEEAQPEVIAAIATHEKNHGADERNDAPSPADELQEREWESASPDELRGLLKGTHELLKKARGLIARQRKQLEAQEHALNVEPTTLKMPKISEAKRKEWIEDGEAALRELMEKFSLRPPEAGIDADLGNR